MPILVASILLLWLSSTLLRGFLRGNPAAMSRRIRQGGGSVALCIAVLMMVKGQFNVAFGAACVGFWMLGSQPGWFKSLFGGGMFGAPGQRSAAPESDVSRVRSASLDMALDRKTGRILGWFTAGPNAGRALDDLSFAECLNGYRWCANLDPQGARLLETYFDRRFAGWRETADGGAHPGGAQPGGRTGRATGMSEDEAHEVLGLAQGAGCEDITRAHRRLMKEYHPDHGGSTAMAARVNEAKDVLMRRHP